MVPTRKFLRRVCSSHRIHSDAQILQMPSHKQSFPVPSSSQSRAWLPSLALAAGASSANSFEGVAAAAAAASGAMEVGGVAGAVAAAAAAVVVVVAVAAVAVAAGGVAGVGGAGVGGRRAGRGAAEEDMTADVGEEEEEEGVRCAEGIEGTVPGEALEDILGEEGGACAFHKAVGVVEHEEAAAHREAATGEVPWRGLVPHRVAADRVDIEGAAEGERY